MTSGPFAPDAHLAAGASLRTALRASALFALADSIVEDCLLGDGDAVFRQAWSEGIDSLPMAARRGALCVEVGAIAESVATVALVSSGLEVFAELAGAGLHGVDILALTPAEQVVAVEVKGTLRGGSTPRLNRSKSRQMSLAWLSQPGNPTMVEWGLDGLDVYGAIAHFDFARRGWRIVLTADHDRFCPVAVVGELLDVSWLE